jgi:hypothetical protein
LHALEFYIPEAGVYPFVDHDKLAYLPFGFALAFATEGVAGAVHSFSHDETSLARPPDISASPVCAHVRLCEICRPFARGRRFLDRIVHRFVSLRTLVHALFDPRRGFT